ncbi:rhomboid-domain-containing protein [Periconia macrospinosa]|uniref:Rhomboid-domain-containing protein n=1 Tax=Periconia macrospinosa TaxID=97972 RepID=A0A2V1DBS9_9PLEO|nr:rhomboid-domain-containing protein [Periconia macrospinosa]
MSLLRSYRAIARPPCSTLRILRPSLSCPGPRVHVGRFILQTRDQHNQPRNISQRASSGQPPVPPPQNEPTINENYPQYQPPNGNQYQEWEYQDPTFPHGQDPKVQILRPAIVTLALSLTFLATFSYLEAKHELKPRNLSLSSFWTARQKPPPSNAPAPVAVLQNEWKHLDPVSKLSWSIIGANTFIHLAGFPFQRLWNSMWHIPALNRTPTLLTSAFVHGGPMHLGFNMWASYQFLPPVGYSKLFRGDTYHITGFLLSAAVLTGWSQHAASTVFKRGFAKITPGGGFSGALFAVLGAYCMEYPTNKIGIVFLPFSFEAQYFMPAVMLFDFVGMVRGYRFVNFGHAAHLSGALMGIAYSYFDGYRNVWRPAVDSWKKVLRN